MTIETKELLGLLIHARAALKKDQPKEALETIRKIIKKIDPDRSIEMEMRESP